MTAETFSFPSFEVKDTRQVEAGELKLWTNNVVSFVNKPIKTLTVGMLTEQTEAYQKLTDGLHCPLVIDGRGAEQVDTNAMLYSLKWDFLKNYGKYITLLKGNKIMNMASQLCIGILNATYKRPKLKFVFSVEAAYNEVQKALTRPYYNYFKNKLKKDLYLKIIVLTFQGKKQEEICKELDISGRTLTNKRGEIQEILGTDNWHHIYAIVEAAYNESENKIDFEGFPDFGSYENLLSHYENVLKPKIEEA